MSKMWTEKELDALKSMWLDGESASKIGSVLRRTRCSVLGAVHRMKELPKRVTTIARSRAQTRLPPTRRQQPLSKDILPASQLKAAEPPIYTRDLEDHHCRFPYDAPDAPDRAGYKYCGAPRSGASRYCNSHNVVVHQHKKEDIADAG